jgi:hypothetical protein
MTNGRKRPKPEDLGDAPETRLQNIPPASPAPDAEERRLVEPPGPAKPREQDAVGEGDVEPMAIRPETENVRAREHDTQRDNIRAIPRDPPPDLKGRLDSPAKLLRARLRRKDARGGRRGST